MTAFRKLSEPSRKVTIYIDGVAIEAAETDSVAAVLSRQEEFWSRKSAISGQRRAPYCMMGVCFECLATVNGAPSSQTCLIKIEEGMIVERQIGMREIA